MQLPIPRGRLTPNRSLSDLTWLRVGGPAEYLFQPADHTDLTEFLADLPQEVDDFSDGRWLELDCARWRHSRRGDPVGARLSMRFLWTASWCSAGPRLWIAM